MIVTRTLQPEIERQPRQGIVQWSVRAVGLSRWGWLLVTGVCLGALVMATLLHPDPRGHGTHEQLGLPPCSFILTTGLPCPTCGMTSAFTLAVRGRLFDAFLAQPAGAALCLLTVLLLPFSLLTAVSGRTIGLDWNRLGPVRVSLSLAMFFLGAWGFKILLMLLTGSHHAR